MLYISFLGRRFKQPNLQNSDKVDDSSDCFFPDIKIDSKISSPNRLDKNFLGSDEITVINPEIEAITKNTRDSKINTVLCIPSKFPGDLFLTIDPNQRLMSIIPRNCEVIKKSTALPELFNLEFIASNIPADINLPRVKDALQKKTKLKQELTKVGKYWSQYANDLSLKDDCVWLDGRLVIPLPLQVPIETRIRFYHDGKRNMFEAARDVWYPYMYRSLATKATYCQQCTVAGKNLKTLLGRRRKSP